VPAGCWLSPGRATGLTTDGHPDWPGMDAPDDLGPPGMVTVLAAVERGGTKVSVCGYLVDVYCLGVKNALGPHSMDRRKLPAFVHQYFSSYDAPPVAAPLDLARHLVLGAVAYAGHEEGLAVAPEGDRAGTRPRLQVRGGGREVGVGLEAECAALRAPRAGTCS
jgi:hypothetical protein